MTGLRVFSLCTLTLATLLGCAKEASNEEPVRDRKKEQDVAKKQAELAAKLKGERSEQEKLLQLLRKKVGVYRYQVKPGRGSADPAEQIVAIEKTGESTWTISSRTTIVIKAAFVTLYSFKQEVTEVWNGMQLSSLKSQTDEDGKKSAVELVSKEGALSGTVNGKAVKFPQVMTTASSLWNLGELLLHTKEISIIDAQQGEMKNYPVSDLGEEILQVGDQKIKCKRIRFAGSKWELWVGPHGLPVKHADVFPDGSVEYTLASWEAGK